MSAQRRTTVKEKTPAPAAVGKTVPASRSKETKPDGRGKAIAESRRNLLAERTQGVRTLFRDSMSEMKKVNWPDRDTVKNLTVVVIGISTVLGLALGGIDYLLQKLFEVMT
jgi:preprotein translocase subunit SecE